MQPIFRMIHPKQVRFVLGKEICFIIKKSIKMKLCIVFMGKELSLGSNLSSASSWLSDFGCEFSQLWSEPNNNN